MEMTLSHDQEIDAWTIHMRDCHLKTREDIDAWRDRLYALLESAAGDGQIALLIDMDSFSVAPALAPVYQETARRVAQRYTHTLLRYGHPAGWTLATIRLAADINELPANVFQDRQAALEALSLLRRHRAAANA